MCVEDLSPGRYFGRKTTPREEMFFRKVSAVNELKDMRWRQRFTNFERSYQLLAQYKGQEEGSELEQAGLIQFFKMSFELAWKLMKDYLEAQQIYVNSPREAIKQSYQIELIDDGHVWIDALTDRNQEYPLPYFFDVIHYENISSEELKTHIDTMGKIIKLK